MPLVRAISTENLLEVENAQGTAGSMPKIDQGVIERLRVPLPPLPEQRRIAVKIEALFAQVNAARKRLTKVPLILKRFRQALLAAACSGRLTEDARAEGSAENWHRGKIVDVCEAVVDCPHSTPKWVDQGERGVWLY
jgi:type I restriction enzyme S subunit